MTPKKQTKTQKDPIQVAARIPREKYTELKVLAAKQNLFLNDLITEGIDYVLKKYSGKRKY